VIAIEGYTGLARIGQGGLGDVYRARRESTGSTVAIKVLRDVSDESVAWHRTRRELTALVALGGHGHVVQLLELLDLPDGPALVMEYAPGGSVADLLRERTMLDIDEVVLVGRHTAAALVAAHRRGIVHRDVKPQNLLIDAHGQVKLCDFGVAALTHSEEFRTRTSALSMRYASPEDLDDELDVGPPSDVYSLGATLLHLLHGAPPTLKDRLARWSPPDTDDATVAALDSVLADCLRPDPAERPSAGEVLDRLDAIDWSLDTRRRSLDPAVAAPVDVAADLADGSVERTGDVDGPDDTTARRADGIPDGSSAAPLERPGAAASSDRSGRRRSGGRWFVAAGVVAVGAFTVAALWPGDRDERAGSATSEPTPTTTPTTMTSVPVTSSSVPVSSASVTTEPAGLRVVERPVGLTPVRDASVEWPFGRPGGCLVQLADAGELAPVDCTGPHDLQRYAVAALDGPVFPDDAPYDPAGVREAVEAACRRLFEPFVGIDPDDSELDVPFSMPSASMWANGDRRYQCFVGVADARLVGDATASGR
jgi:serine/threonine protein kinase